MIDEKCGIDPYFENHESWKCFYSFGNVGRLIEKYEDHHHQLVPTSLSQNSITGNFSRIWFDNDSTNQRDYQKSCNLNYIFYQ